MGSSLQIVSDYFDGFLTPEKDAKLRDWLLESRKHIDDFVVDCFVHTQLIDVLSPHQMRANALVAAELGPKKPAPLRSLRSMGRILALAAALLLVIAIGYMATASRRSIVATISGTSNALWTSAKAKRTVGSLLRVGDEIDVKRGTVRLTFARGGQVALHGPGRFRVDSETGGQLLLGSISAFVPEHAVGFTVRTKKLKLVDLGTEFYIDRLEDDSCVLQVYSGLVEIQYDEPVGDAPSHKTLQISQGRAIRFDAKTGSVSTIEYNGSNRLPMSVWSQ